MFINFYINQDYLYIRTFRLEIKSNNGIEQEILNVMQSKKFSEDNLIFKGKTFYYLYFYHILPL